MKGRRNIPGSVLNENINVLHALMRPGERLPSRSIAEIVGCTHGLVYLIEKRAVRERLRRQLGLSYTEFFRQSAGDHL